VKLALRSDFVDFYDLAFDARLPGVPVFQRFSRDAADRVTLLRALRLTLGENVPTFGTARDCLRGWDDDSMWVAHFDPFAHRGEGKVVLAAGVLRREHPPETIVVKYIDGNRGRSLRHLQIGRRAFLLHYESADDWRSNCGDVRVMVSGRAHPMTEATWPLLAVDYVTDGSGRLWAIDLNTAPGMTGTGIEDLMTPDEVVDEIKGAMAARLAS